MNKLESLISKHHHLQYVFTDKMPDVLKGLCYDDEIHINTNVHKNRAELIVTISEEIAHYETGSGNITKQNSISEIKQEHKARKYGNFRLVSLEDLIHCRELGYKLPHEIADELEITEECVINAIDNYRITKGFRFFHKGYRFNFITDSVLEINKLGGEYHLLLEQSNERTFMNVKEDS